MKKLFGIVFVVAIVIGCGKTPAPAERLYDVKGKVVAVDAQKPSVTLDHDDIPGLMQAMTMEFAVRDAKVLAGIAVGDSVRGRIRKDDGGYVLRSLEKQSGG
jgi:protein SCO1/2